MTPGLSDPRMCALSPQPYSEPGMGLVYFSQSVDSIFPGFQTGRPEPHPQRLNTCHTQDKVAFPQPRSSQTPSCQHQRGCLLGAPHTTGSKLSGPAQELESLQLIGVQLPGVRPTST